MITDYHSKLFAHEFRRRRSAGDSKKLVGALLNAQIDLNPRQVEAPLFAFKLALSKGAKLDDELGLTKTTIDSQIDVLWDDTRLGAEP
jgi:hypothetical protein